MWDKNSWGLPVISDLKHSLSVACNSCSDQPPSHVQEVKAAGDFESVKK